MVNTEAVTMTSKHKILKTCLRSPDEEKDYEMLQQEWRKQNSLGIGSYVRVVRRPAVGAKWGKGNVCFWADSMNTYISHIYMIKDFHPYGVKLENSAFYFPYTCFDIITHVDLVNLS